MDQRCKKERPLQIQVATKERTCYPSTRPSIWFWLAPRDTTKLEKMTTNNMQELAVKKKVWIWFHLLHSDHMPEIESKFKPLECQLRILYPLSPTNKMAPPLEVACLSSVHTRKFFEKKTSKGKACRSKLHANAWWFSCWSIPNKGARVSVSLPCQWGT